MNESRAKLLTGYIGECWHEWGLPTSYWKCKICGNWTTLTAKPQEGSPRTFDTWADFGKVVEVLQKKGDWKRFEDWAFGNFDHPYASMDLNNILPDYFAWLLNPGRFCELAAQWIEQK